MILRCHNNKRGGSSAFSLIEVVIAIGIFSGSILAIIAMLGAISQSTTEVLDAGVSARLADGVRAELQALPISGGGANLDAIIPVSPTTDSPLRLYANKDGSRILRGEPEGSSPADNHPETGDPPGIADPDRYYLVEVRRLGDSLTYNSNDAGFMALSVKVYWPYQVRTGPNDTDLAVVEDHRRSMAMFNVAVRRTQ